MTESQKIDLEIRSKRGRLGELGARGDALTADEKTEFEGLPKEIRERETAYAKALREEDEAAEKAARDLGGEPDAETRERLELRSKATFTGFLRARLQGHEPAGELAEYRAACQLPPEVAGGIPLDLFENDRPALETRADVATGAPATGTGVTVAPVQPHVFSASIAPMLGIAMPRVGSGAFSEMTISTALSAGARAKGAARESTAAVLTPKTTNPRSISARLTLRIEDIASVGVANYERALRENLRMALSDALDSQAITGDGAGSNITGLIKALEAINNPTDPTAVTDFDAFVAAFTAQVDGLWARMLSHVAMVVNPETYRLAAGTFRDKIIDDTTTNEVRAAASLGEVSFADYAMAKAGGFSTNKRMPAGQSNISRAIVHRKGVTGLRTACLPTWGAVTIDDPYTDSASGTKQLTMHVLVGDKVLLVQPDAYALSEFKTA